MYSNDEHIVDLAQQINGRISARAQKHYPSNTVLIVNCETDGLILEDEWKSAIKQVESQASHTVFRESVHIRLRGTPFGQSLGLGQETRAKVDRIDTNFKSFA